MKMYPAKNAKPLKTQFENWYLSAADSAPVLSFNVSKYDVNLM